MDSVMQLDNAPFPVELAQGFVSTSGDRQEVEHGETRVSRCEEKMTELLELSTQFIANVKNYRTSIDTNVETRRAVLQCSMSSSGKLLAVLQAITTPNQHISLIDRSNLSDVHEAPALLAQALSCYMLEARQWNFILSHILQSLRESPVPTEVIAQVIPSTRIEGLVFNTALLQTRLFLQACMHTTQALCKHMDCLVEALSESGRAPVNTKEVLKEMRLVHTDILGIFEKLQD
jgi:hypothetical protein